MIVCEEATADRRSVGRVCPARISTRGRGKNSKTDLGGKVLESSIVLSPYIRSLKPREDLLDPTRHVRRDALMVRLSLDFPTDVGKGLGVQSAHLGRLVRGEEDRLAKKGRFAIEVPRLDAGEVTAVSLSGRLVETVHDELRKTMRDDFEGERWWDSLGRAPSSASSSRPSDR
jgi:hypothetical protein